MDEDWQPDELLPEGGDSELLPVAKVVRPIEIRCKRCELRFSESAPTCPHCGAKNKRAERYQIADETPAKSQRPLFVKFKILLVIFLVDSLFAVVWGIVINSAEMTAEDFLVGTIILDVIFTIAALVAWFLIGHQPSEPVSGKARWYAWLLAMPAVGLLLLMNHFYFELLRSMLSQDRIQLVEEVTWDRIIIICVQPALIEELFFRYLAFGLLLQVTGRHLTVWTTGAMFAIAHLYNPIGMPYLLIAGVVFGYFRLYGGLLLPMIMHFFHNLIVISYEQWL